MLAPKASKQNWKVVWVIQCEPARGPYKGELQVKRCVAGILDAQQAWNIYWNLRAKRNDARLLRGPELWRGRVRVL